jgi:nucleotide-binding universal stress UspA family protein
MSTSPGAAGIGSTPGAHDTGDSASPAGRANDPRGSYVLVGIDGSDPSCAALHWAVREASATGLRVVAVYAAEPPSVWPGFAYAVVADPVPAADMSGEVRSQVAQTLRNAGVEGLVDVETRVLPGHPAQVLLEAADGAALIVVGRRGHGGFAAAIMGSTSRYVSAHANVPVVVVPHE